MAVRRHALERADYWHAVQQRRTAECDDRSESQMGEWCKWQIPTACKADASTQHSLPQKKGEEKHSIVHAIVKPGWVTAS
jgi:hypothetical protein